MPRDRNRNLPRMDSGFTRSLTAAVIALLTGCAAMLGRRIDMSNEAIRRDLERGKGASFEQTQLYVRVFALADRVTGKPAPRAVVPQIPLHIPKIALIRSS